MGRGHHTPSKTRKNTKITESVTRHTHIDVEKERFEVEDMERLVKEAFKREFDSFSEPLQNKWVGDERILLINGAGVELRIFYQRDMVYYSLVATEDLRTSRPQLGFRHLHSYQKTLEKVMRNIYGETRRKTTAWTSEPIEA